MTILNRLSAFSSAINRNIDSVDLFDFRSHVGYKSLMELNVMLFAVVAIFKIKFVVIYAVFDIHFQIFFSFHPIDMIWQKFEEC